ncbi:hypothetical protein ACIRG4_35025 [Streptomyces sp. NPDC102395]|uniref:hypothetical protein n=1 Tax=Streptomyces sp. NPDC102395 TaxID=3366168 RepID=UPI003816C58D
MSEPVGLRPENRADFEAVLHLALGTPDIRSALRTDPTGGATARLRLRALAHADEIATAAQGEYHAYLTRLFLNASAEETKDGADAGLLSALAVLTPLVAGPSAAVLLVLGYMLQLVGVHGTLPSSLVTAGWILGLVAALSALVALVALLGAAVLGRGSSVHSARLEQARLDWQQALLERGLLPHLRQHIGEDPALRPTRAHGDEPPRTGY